MTSVVLASLCAGVLIGLCLQGTFILVGLVAISVIIYACYMSNQFHGKSIPFEGKAVVITGCDSGFGKYLAEKLDDLGFTVFACCLFPNKGGADYLRQKCSSKLHLLKVDVTNDADVSEAVDFVRNNIGTGKLWALVNNAGLSRTGEVEWTDMSTYEKIYAVNVFGVMRVSKAFLPMIRESKGRVINVASMAGRFGLSGFASYCSSKFACIGFSDCLRREMKKFGVTVHTIEPAFYKTEMTNLDYQLKLLEKTWDATPDRIKKAYTHEFYEAFRQDVVNILTKTVNPNPYQVVDCMLDAVTSLEPKTTYTITFPFFLKCTIVGLVSTRVQDFLLMRRDKNRNQFIK